MQTNIFPEEYNRIINEKTNSKISEARSRHSDRKDSIYSILTPAPQGGGVLWGAMIGIFGGFIACSCVCVLNNNAGAGFATWIVISIICAGVGFAIDKLLKNSYEDDRNKVDTRIKEEERRFENEIQKIQNDAEIEEKRYCDEFENNAQNLSVQFAESELAKEVIEWMTDGFSKMIDATDRRGHVEKIEVPFMFKVFNNKIICNLGTFDFELKRCRNLTSPLEQTALARAIVSAMQLNIIMQYPKDVSGTETSINISYAYTNECPIITITYVAPNGNYKAVRSW